MRGKRASEGVRHEQRSPGPPPTGPATVAVSWIHGCAVQAMVEPEHFEVDEYLAGVRGMVGRLA